MKTTKNEDDSKNELSIYMVESHEDAYWPDNLSLFTVNCEHNLEPKKTK